MAIFGRGFPSKSHPFGAISVAGFLGVVETIDVIGVATHALTSAEAQSVSQSGNATQALSVEATREPNKDNQGTATTRLGVDATAETESNSATGSQTITLERTSDTESSSGSATTSLTVEATKETESNTGTATISIYDSLPEPSMVNTSNGSQFLSEAIAESVLGSEIQGGIYSDNFNRADEDPIGAPWVALPESIGHARIHNQIVQSESPAQDGDKLYYNTNSSSVGADQYSQVIMSPGILDGGPAVRIGGNPTGGGFSGYLITGFDSKIAKFIDHSYTALGSNISSYIFPGSTVKIVVFDQFGTSRIEAWVDGILRDFVIDGTVTGAGNGPGWFSYQSFSPDDLIDDWVGGEVGAVAAGNAQNIPTINTYDTDTIGNSGSGSNTSGEKIAETVSNSATATIAIDETIDLGADFLTNTGAATLRINEADASTESGTGSGSPSLSEATAETITNHGGVAGGGTYGEGEYGEGEYGEGSGGENQTILEAVAETDTNTGTASFTLSTTEVASEGNTGTGTQTFAEAIAETVSNSAEATITIGDIVQEQGDELTNEGTGTLRINEAEATDETGSGTGDPTLSEATAETTSTSATDTPTITEAVAEGVDNSATNTPSFDEQSPEINLTSVALSTQSLGEAIAESLTNSASSTQTFAEADADSPQNSATNTPSLIDYETDTPVNTGTGSHFTDGEKIAEIDTVAMLATLTMDEQRDVVVVPFSDISTGTWTVAPLYEKVDELVVASGYPTETIRSANNPSNDTAILGLSPVSDPGIDDNHFINVEFYKDGTETLDFIINLKENGNLIATRTFTDVQETESAPRRERIALSNGEASAIVDYSNLNVELIANQTS